MFRFVLAMMLAASAIAANAADSPPRRVYILAGALLDRPGTAPRGPSTIIVENERILAVEDGFREPPSDARVIDLRDAFVMPGLIDSHVHLFGIAGDPLRARLEAMTRDGFDDELTAVANARATLRAGFTSVRDLGGDARGVRALRDAIDKGVIEGPTITNAGDIISVTGGHGDKTNGLAERFADAVHQHQVNICDGPDDCRRAVRAEVGLGAQVIKFAATGGVLSNVSGGLARAMTFEEMQAIVETAHGLGRKVAAHSHAVEGTRNALRAGVDSIEHGTFLDDEAIRLFKETGAYLVPTMLAPVTVTEQARAGALPAAVLPKIEQASAAANASIARAIAAGVKIAFGTDTGVSKPGENGREFALMVKAGMRPADAIKAATVSAADLLGKDDVGSIAPGKYADIISVERSPLQQVDVLEHVRFVMHRGQVVKDDR